MSVTTAPTGNGRAWRRFAYPVVLAVACVLVIASHVDLGFERVRFRVVTTPEPADEPVVTVPLPDLASLAGSPAAVIVRLRGAATPTEVTVTLDGELLTQVALAPEREVRVDASVVPPSGSGHQLTLHGGRAGWQLAYLEIANIHGHSSGLLSFVIVPRARRADVATPQWLLVPIVVALLALRPRTDWPDGRLARVLHRTGGTVVLLLFAVTVLSDLVTPFRIVLSLGSALLCLALLYAEPIARGWRHPVWTRPALRPLRPLLPHLVVVILVLWSLGQFYRSETGFTSLILFGERFDARAVPALQAIPRAVYPGAGYDGQFYAQLALDPLLRDDATAEAMDLAPYRARRILFSWVAAALGGGQPWLVVQTYALLNVACWLGLAWLLLRWLPAGTVRPLSAWAACLLSHGALASMRQSVPDGPSLLLLALGIVAVERHRHWLATAILGLSGLGRETNLLGGIILPRRGANASALGRLAVQGAILLVPLVAWTIYLWSLGLPAVSAGSRNFALPLAGFLEQWTVTLAELQADGWNLFTRARLLTQIALTTQALVLIWYRDWRSAWWRLGVVYLGLMLMLGPAVWAGSPGAVTRVVLPMTVAFNVRLPRVRWFWPLWILGNANLLDALDLIGIATV